ncbi:MAG: putative metal-dependent hydrolase [Nitrospinota bacterium]|nr:MAG: putative metal-dependent hydrolase [Nitrospinota bacterium]
MSDLRYPIGKFQFDSEVTEEKRQAWIADLAEMPARLQAAVAGLSPEQLDTPYRPEGWTVRQVVHHLADSHLASYVRFRQALTEEEPGITPYDQNRWAALPDARTAPVELSLTLLDALHQRWVLLLRSLSPADFARTVRHPRLGVLSLEKLLNLYAWHGRHHTAQITSLRERMGWA